jgi:hypothetical protein
MLKNDCDELSKDEKKFLYILHKAARLRASGLNISSTDYLIGILEGIFPQITLEELCDAEESARYIAVTARN